MFRNHIKMALRNMANHKGYSFINIAGLTVGIAVCLLIFLWVNDELSYDRFHTKSDRIYRALWEARFGDNEWKIPLVPVPLAETLEREFPEVETTTRLLSGGYTLKLGEEFIREQHVLFVDDDFFDVFTTQFISGDPATALQQPDAIVLTASSAARYFPGQDPLGQTIEQNEGKPLQVTGVVRDYPGQSHLQFDFLSSLDNMSRIEDRKDQWGSAACFTYFVLKPEADPDALQEKLSAYIDKNVAGDEFKKGDNYTSFPFQPLADIHLKSNLEYELGPNGNLTYVYLFAIIAFIILVLACINFINLATARSMTRAREVGVRKVLGSKRSELIRQFFIEASCYVFIAITGAVILAEMALPFFNQFADKSLEISWLDSPFLIILLTALLIMTTLLTGAFPALVLSGFKPASVLKGQFRLSNQRNWLRQGLVVVQFCISIGLIIGTLVVRDQLHYLQNKQLGFNQEQVLVLERGHALGNNYDAFLEKLNTLPGVERVSIAQSLPGKQFDSTVFTPGQPSNFEQTSLSYAFVGGDFVNTLELKMLEGRDFSPELSTDSTAVLINEAAAQRLGWEDPVGRELTYGGRPAGRVVGVVDNFHFQSLHHEVEPIVLLLSPWRMPYIAIRLKAGNLTDNLTAVQSVWTEFTPNTPMEYSFLDSDFQQLYEGEKRMSELFTVFSMLAILIACLGLFGLASFLASQRRKEIGIRKVLGATTPGIVGLLSKDFLKLVVISLVIASPIAWWAMNQWLADFAYRTNIGLWIFAVAGFVAILVALLTVSYQSVKAAMANPVKSLRSE